jgi:hypothetical protein
MDKNHRLLRAIEGNDALREYFELGVNFIESPEPPPHRAFILMPRDDAVL